MKSSNLKKIIFAFAVAVMSITAAFCAYAKDTPEMATSDYFMVADMINVVEKNAKELSDGADRVRQDFVYAENDVLIPTAAGNHTNVESYIYDSELDITKEEAFIAIFRKFIDTDGTTDITIRYSTEDSDAMLALKTKDEVFVYPEYLSYASVKNDGNNNFICTLKLTADELHALSYYSDDFDKMDVLKLVSTGDSINISGISIAQDKGGYAVTKRLLDEYVCVYPIAYAFYSVKADETEAVLFEVGDNKVSMESLSNCTISKECYDAYEIVEGTKPTHEQLNAALEFSYVERFTETDEFESETEDGSDVESAELYETDIDEREYLNLEENGSVLRGGYLFTSDGIGYYNRETSENVTTDEYLNVFTEEVEVGKNNKYLPSSIDMLGSNYEDLLLAGNVMLIKIANVKASEYAGELNVCLSSAEKDVVTTVTDKVEMVDAASDSNCEEIVGGSDPVLELSDAVDEQEDKIDESVLGPGGMIPEECLEEEPEDIERIPEYEEITVTKTVREKEYLRGFVKGEFDTFEADDDNILLTEAFLKKSSYCAIDDDGIVCAVFNEHGRKIEMLEGYSEEDIAAYILIPDIDDENEDMYLSDVSVTYNDELILNDVYASVLCSDEDGMLVNTSANVYAHIDAGMYFEISAYINNTENKVTLLGNIDPEEIQISNDDSYDVSYEIGNLDGAIDTQEQMDESDTAEETEESKEIETSENEYDVDIDESINDEMIPAEGPGIEEDISESDENDTAGYNTENGESEENDTGSEEIEAEEITDKEVTDEETENKNTDSETVICPNSSGDNSNSIVNGAELIDTGQKDKASVESDSGGSLSEQPGDSPPDNSGGVEPPINSSGTSERITSEPITDFVAGDS